MVMLPGFEVRHTDTVVPICFRLASRIDHDCMPGSSIGAAAHKRPGSGRGVEITMSASDGLAEVSTVPASMITCPYSRPGMMSPGK